MSRKLSGCENVNSQSLPFRLRAANRLTKSCHGPKRWDRVGDARPQLGEFDSEILCAACDNKLGGHDDYLIDVCKVFRSRHIRISPNRFELPNVEGDRLVKAVLAILWRASISRRPNFQKIDLGPYEGKVREVLFGITELATLPQIQMLAERYEHERIDVEGFYTHPVRSQKGSKYNFYNISIGGFNFITKIDSRAFPNAIAPYIINGNSFFRGSFTPLEETKAHSTIA